jgi:hypothetical protein
MKNSSNLIEILMISACFMAAQPSHAMVQNLLDYIKTYKAPVSQKSVDRLLLTPRLLKAQYQEPVFRYPFNLLEYSNPLKWWLPFAVQITVPGILPKMLNKNILDIDYLFTKATYHENVGLIQSFIASGYDVNRNNGRALLAAATVGNAVIVKMLLQAGADVTLADYDEDHNAEYYARIRPTDSPEVQKNKLEIQRLLRFYKAKEALKPQVKDILPKPVAAHLTREDIEEHLKTSGSTAGAHDITGIIKGYL